ncbi:D-amino-acid transaminase [Bacillus sp. AGMB 02131]|uniref:D-alanine aminotransferase n=1 Tax=Peribacillus faecalis TaxID=2772559 RepID=A0A927HCY1_9BACI|nr:D-amino-acid transaminase [Peribacillus faecalis]MBD3110514.1 D-amino-acid transaminase [Peribacillus faecalis]
MGKVFLNGQFIDRTDAKIDIEDRGNVFGDGIYEVVRVYDGKLFTLEKHLQRLMRSAEKIYLRMPYEPEQIKAILMQLVKENDLELGIVYIQVSRGAAVRQHIFPGEDVPVTFFAFTKALKRPDAQMKNGVKAKTAEDIRWLKCDIKSLNLLGNILAKQDAASEGCYEAIFVRDGFVTEGSSSNIHIVKNGKVKTHPANHLILNGISRIVMLEQCEKLNITVEQSPFTENELLQADEAFMTSTTSEITPIVEVNGEKIGNGLVGPTTLKLQQSFESVIKEQCKA